MNILLCERSMSGHRKTYIQYLEKNIEYTMYTFAPDIISESDEHSIIYKKVLKNELLEYIRWVIEIKKIVDLKQIDIVHVLDGDSIMKFFGLGFSWWNVKQRVITYHHFFEGMLRKISYRMMSKKAICVVHTADVADLMMKTGVKNVKVCGYPAFQFDSISKRESISSKEYFGIEANESVIGIIGGLSSYKHIIQFLEALSECNFQYKILLCGKVEDIDSEKLNEKLKRLDKRVISKLSFLSQEDYENAIVASDIIFCIYGHEFDGASGLLTDGVCAKKMILSCKHGSLGSITTKNELGLTVECDSKNEVQNAIEDALKRCKSFEYTEKAEKFRDSLKPSFFVERYSEIYREM